MVEIQISTNFIKSSLIPYENFLSISIITNKYRNYFILLKFSKENMYKKYI